MRYLLPRSLGAALLLATSLFAQEPAPPPPASTPAPRPITREQSIYIPFEKLEQVFEKQERGVFLPYREFLEMWNKLNLPQHLKTPPPPVEGVLSSANYTGKVEGDVASIKAALSFEALKEGWSKLSLGANGLALAEAKSKAVLSATDGGYEILFPEKGTYTLDATLYGRITREAGRNSLQLPLPKTAVSQFELTLPDKGLEFTIEPAAAYSAKENPDGSTKLLVYFGAAESVTISWTRRAGETALKPLLFAEVHTSVHLSPGAVRTDSELAYRILRAGVQAFDIQVPADQQVLSVEGENIREWSVTPPAAGTQRVHVALFAVVRDEYSLSISLERALGPLPQAVAFPVIRAEGAERQTGTVALLTEPELTTEVSELQELTQKAATAGGEGEERAQGEYRYLHLPYAGKVTVAEAKPQVEIASQTLVTVKLDRAELRTTMDCTVKRAGIFALQIEVPAGFGHFDATGAEVESATLVTVAGKQLLEVKFASRRTGQFSFTITGDATREKPESPLVVPVFQPGVERHDAKVGIAIPLSLKANTTDRGDLREEDVRGLLAQQPSAGQGGREAEQLTLGFRYRGAAKPAQVSFELRKPRVSAEVATLLEVRESLLRHTWHIHYQVEYAGIDELSLSVPAEIANDLQIEGADIKERTKSPPSAPAGQPGATVTWRVALQAKVLGSYILHVSHETARGEQKPGQVAPVALEELTVLNVFRETGQVAVVKDGNMEITKNDPKALELIDPKEVGPDLRQDGIFLAWKYAAHPIALRLDVSKNLFLEVPSAIVNYAVLGSVISEDQAETTEVIYWVKNNGQQFFAVQLPGEARLLSDAFVDGQPQQPSRRPDRNELLIRLPATTADSHGFPVRFVYERPSAHPGQKLGWRGTLHLEPPHLAGVQTLQSLWTLYLPSDNRYIRFDGSMREPVGERGWDLFRAGLDLFVPEFGPVAPGPGSTTQADPPPLPAPKTAGFDTQLQKEGDPVTLRRLGEPAAIEVAYRGRAYAATVEAIAFLLALAGGLALLGRSRRERFAYFLIVGFGALVIAGARDPRGAGFWQALYLGAFAALAVWLAIGLFRKIGRLRWPRRRQPEPPPIPPTVPTA